MKYDADISPDDANTSHHLVVEFVGSGKRVLDVGCSSGYLAAALTVNGNTVSGVEIDPEAAEKARAHVDRLVVGDVEQRDLVDDFGENSFDVVVFADVLEHLKDPVAALRRARPLIAKGGFLVASIPNVAHGAVRLALMQGRFEYQELGLLDDTHLRFFTRTSVGELFESAGYLATDLHRTTADIFGTEIPLSREEIPADVIDRIAQDPEATTYQFVVRAIPLSRDALGEPVLTALTEKSHEVEGLRRQLGDIARVLAGVPPRPIVGVLDAYSRAASSALAGIAIAVTVTELRRRLGGFEIRTYLLAEQPAGVGLGDEAAVPLLPWDGPRSRQLLSEADALVVCGDPGTSDAEAVTAELSGGGMAVQVLDPKERAPRSPRPHALARRLLDSAILDQRAEYLRILGELPRSGDFVLTHLTNPDTDHASSGPDSLQEIADEFGLTLLDVSDDQVPVDLLAKVAASRLVVTDSVDLGALAVGLGRRVVGITVDGTEQDLGLSALVTAALTDSVGTGHNVPLDRSSAEREADLYFDQLAGNLLSAAGQRLAQTVPERVTDLTRQVAALEAVNAGLRQSLVRERVAITARIRHLYPDLISAGLAERPTPAHLHDQIRQAEAQIEHLQSEIKRIYATRMMRAVQPVRRLYGRLRSSLR